jgi:two-component system sensor histidine kinase CpxA
MPRLSLSGKIIALALLNMAVVAGAGYLFIRVQVRSSAESFLLAPASDKIWPISSEISQAIGESSREEWDTILRRIGERVDARVRLATPTGERIAGAPGPLPREVAENFPPPRNQPRTERKDRTKKKRGPPAPIFIAVSEAPQRYWVVARLPIRQEDGSTQPGAVIIETDTAFNPHLFYDPQLVARMAFAVALLSAICWAPFLTGVTGTIRKMDNAAQKIAEGDFDIRVASTRRDELGHLSAQIDRMASRLANYVSGQKRFLGDIAHELCAPIARIQVALGILEYRVAPADRQRLLDLSEEVEQLAALVNELLQFSKLALGAEVTLAPVNVASAVDKAVTRESSSGARLEVEVDQSLAVVANETLFTRSLSNLVRNSIRYAGTAGPVRISARADAGNVVVTVADCGPGVREDALEKIFEPFYRAEQSRTRESGGVGLGLAIVKSGIESCNGTVACRNRDPKGLEVTIRLPEAAKL